MCDKETMDTKNAFCSLVMTPEGKSHLENAAEIKPLIGMGIGEIGYVSQT
jgi:hypothetical protein